MHQTKSWGCRFVDQDLGRIAPSGLERNLGGSGACHGAPYKERLEIDVAFGEVCYRRQRETG